MSSSLIISTYNWPEALELCLLSVLQQKVLPNDVIIADDGSAGDTRKLIQKYAAQFPVPLIHVWHKKNGFRLAEIRNKAIARASGDYVIQIDGDIILHPHFIRDHLNHLKKGYFITGSRVLLQDQVTRKSLYNKTTTFGLIVPGSSNILNGLRSNLLRVFLSGIYKTRGKHKYYVKGCNMSFWKRDLLLVNGYNESFSGWGQEDNEIAIKLINSGVKKRFLKFGAVCYHLNHQKSSASSFVKNSTISKSTLQKKILRSHNGIDKYLLTPE